MGKLIRCISEDGTLTVMAVDTTDIVNRAQEIHGTSAVVSAALGRLRDGGEPSWAARSKERMTPSRSG